MEVTPERECLRGLPTGFIIPDKEVRRGSVVFDGVRCPIVVPGPIEVRLLIGSAKLRLIGSAKLRRVNGSLALRFVMG